MFGGDFVGSLGVLAPAQIMGMSGDESVSFKSVDFIKIFLGVVGGPFNFKNNGSTFLKFLYFLGKFGIGVYFFLDLGGKFDPVCKAWESSSQCCIATASVNSNDPF